MNNIEGRISIDISTKLSNNNRINIHSNRPTYLSNLFVGKSPKDVLEITPLIFSICGSAQSITALRAIENQQGTEINSLRESAQNIIILIESVKEHLLRILLDWPKLFQLEKPSAPLAFITQLVNKAKQALFKDGSAYQLDSKLDIDQQAIKNLITEIQQILERWVFNEPYKQWLERTDYQSLIQWSQRNQAISAQSVDRIIKNNWHHQCFSSCQLLPDFDPEELHKSFSASNSSSFIAEPMWQGEYFETGPLARQNNNHLLKMLNKDFKNGLLTRWVSRLVELAETPSQLNLLIQQLSYNPKTFSNESQPIGLAETETARGRLIHRVKIKNNKIEQYQILAPTEWNFHPKGLIYKSLQNINVKRKSEIEPLAHLLINAIDPCVGYKLRVH